MSHIASRTAHAFVRAMIPVAWRVAYVSSTAVAKPRTSYNNAGHAPSQPRQTLAIRTSGRVCRPVTRVSCLHGSLPFSTGNNAGSNITSTFQKRIENARGSTKTFATTENRFDTSDDATFTSGVWQTLSESNFAAGAHVERTTGVSQSTRTAFALVMMLGAAATIAISFVAPIPLPDLPRPETWALMHPTSYGFRGLAFDWGGFLRFCDYFGTALFAQSGVIQAGKKGMDFLGCLLVGCITAMGGGTFGGFVLGEKPVFWAGEQDYLYISLAASVLTFFFWPKFERWWLARGCVGDSQRDAETHSKNEHTLNELLNWGDALSIGAFCVIGANNGLRGADGSPLIAIATGMFTASFGGIIRDTFCAVPARILHSHQEVYASVTMLGACSYVCLSAMQMSVGVRILTPILLVMAIRKFAWTEGLRLPSYRED